MLQPLERRRFLSASIIDGVLTITGTEGDDEIFVYGLTSMFHPQPGFPWPPNEHRALVQRNGFTLGNFDIDDFTAIRVDAGDGNDRVRVYSQAERLPDDGLGVPEGIAKQVLLEINGGAGNDTLEGTGGDDTLFGGRGNDLIYGGSGNDIVSGGHGNDKLDGGDGDDIITGSYGNDGLTGGATGADTFIGGAGRDTVDYSHRREGLTITIDDVANDGAPEQPFVSGLDIGIPNPSLLGERDNVRSDVENVIGGSGADFVTGDDDANVLIGGGGNDDLNGKGGNDSLFGHAGSDLLGGGLGADLLSGGSHLTVESKGDAADYRDRAENLVLSLDGVANDGAAGEGDQIIEIERVFGGSGDDSILGSDEDDALHGFGGSDTLRGAGGHDELEGDQGQSEDDDNDYLEGGRGNDMLIAGLGRNTLFGNAGRDAISARGYGDDLVDGGPDRDRGLVDPTDVVISLEDSA
jgi:Ca2+-binding RTX toxin-like protein